LEGAFLLFLEMYLKKGGKNVLAAGAAKGVPGWAGGGPLRFLFYREKRKRTLLEGIDDLDAIDDTSMLHIFGEQHTAPRLPGAVKNQRIPEGDLVQPVDVDGCENIRGDRLNKVETRIDLDLLSRQAWIETELPRGVHKVFL
jgi:hypothetical protein